MFSGLHDNNLFALLHESLSQEKEPENSTAFVWEQERKRTKPPSLRVHFSNLPKLEKQLRRILSYLRMRDGPPMKIRKEDDYYFQKAIEILISRSLISRIPGYWDRQNPKNSRAPLFTPTDTLLPLLRSWKNPCPLPMPSPKPYQKPFLMREWNEEYAKHTYVGCDVPVLVRYPRDKNGEKHGRMYALGAHSYQARKDRENIQVDGKEYADIDISASHLTAFLSWHGFDFTQGLGERDDLYQIEGIPRDVVKLAVMLILGKGTTQGLSWYDLDEGQPPATIPAKWRGRGGIAKVVAKLLETYPALGLVKPQDRPLLVWHEAEALHATIDELLLSKGIVVLGTHDSLTVPLDHLEECSNLLAKNYQKQFGREPGLKVVRRRVPLSPPTGGASGNPMEPSSLEDLLQEILSSALFSRCPVIPNQSHQVSIREEQEEGSINLVTYEGNNRTVRRRPKTTTREQEEAIIAYRKGGMSIRKIAKLTRKKKNVIERVLLEHKDQMKAPEPEISEAEYAEFVTDSDLIELEIAAMKSPVSYAAASSPSGTSTATP